VSDALTARQRARLKALAHPLKPILQIGREGVGETVISAVETALRTRELLKVKVLEAAPVDTRAAAEALAAAVAGVHVVQVIGRTAVLYRRHPEQPEIQLD
jgi:RNA-binding protein